ncbi:Ca2+-binding RTX toxin-like protein [Microvirga flocculans]|uniref:Ca2+-binding RTX toxin-like protein n=1 Tax=Microvirga flocculans TaxID=217168 RepID=A0A7W6IH72_9HYPH|nr:hypothetical protein [Microvirga flocculans]MBB4041421.1 Ca2+-binding RTX toxin-like protein [Microvirga flocculans]
MESTQFYSHVTALDDGGWVVAWVTNDYRLRDDRISQQRFNADGVPAGEEQRISNLNTSHSNPKLTSLRDGGWIVTWAALEGDQVNGDIVQQRYNAQGMAVGGEQKVNTFTDLNQYNPAAAGLEDGSWVVTWTSEAQDGSSQGVYQQLYKSVAAFGDGRERGSGTAGNDIFNVQNGGLAAGDTLEGGEGIDTLRMVESGTLDLTAPDVLTGIEILQGSSGNDVIMTDAVRLGQIVGLRGGTGFDELRLKMSNYDFSNNFFSEFEMISFSGPGTLAFADKPSALLAHSLTANGSVTLSGDAFTLTERQRLYDQGIRKATDAKGVHILQPGDVFLDPKDVRENAQKGAVVGELTTVDPNPGDGMRVELVDNAGGRFSLSGNKIVVANGKLLDYETAGFHIIVVRIVDEGGIAVEKVFRIDVVDEPVEIIRGTRFADVLKGGSGKDRIYGYLGKDTLTGGKGQDAFVFNTKPNTKKNGDKITDFNVKDDAIWLENKIFTKLGKAGSEAKPALLKKSYFVKGAKAKDKNDYVIYDDKKGKLYYDADGSGSKYKQVEIATLSKKLAMTYKDFFIV